jgi:chemotaxis protein CheD
MPEIDEVAEIYLNPGESCFARKPAILRTILGSCVGVTLWSPRLAIGGLTHSQLPRAPAQPPGLDPLIGRRYVDFAIREMLRQFDRLGVPRGELEVKLFGGADVLQVPDAATSTVGKQNCEAAIEVVRAEGLPVLASSLGGTSGVNLRFDTRTGVVEIRRHSRS